MSTQRPAHIPPIPCALVPFPGPAAADAHTQPPCAPWPRRIANLFEAAGCNTSAVKHLLGPDGVTESNMLAYLGVLELRCNELLQVGGGARCCSGVVRGLTMWRGGGRGRGDAHARLGGHCGTLCRLPPPPPRSCLVCDLG